jgi:hypothetical protein
MPMHGDDAVSQGGGIGDGDRREVQCVLASDRPAAQPHRGRWWSKLFAADTDRLGWYVATRDMHGGRLICPNACASVDRPMLHCSA